MKLKGRPRKKRIVRHKPGTVQFSPRGKRGRPGYNELKFEEYEAIRLADFTGLKQADAAGQMGISQQTFSRVLNQGRKCLAEALVLGRIIKVGGGEYKLAK
jgi:predicted DNA-binding protein (UPF0251 family)